jgi:hypothetical protein
MYYANELCAEKSSKGRLHARTDRSAHRSVTVVDALSNQVEVFPAELL